MIGRRARFTSFHSLTRGRVDDLSVFKYLSPFFFVNRISLYFFPFLIKYYHILFIIIVFWLGCGRSCPLRFFSILTPLFLPPSSVSLSYFILGVPMRKCLGKHSCMSSHLL